MNSLLRICFFFVFMFSLFASAENREGEVQKVKLQLKWKHQFQFAGYYAAIEKGYYRDAGMEVEILEAQSGENSNDAVLNGKADFGISNSEVLLLRSKHKNTVVLASIFQHSPTILLALQKSGIQHANDLIGKRLALEDNIGEIMAYLDEEGVPINRCVVVPRTFDLEQLTSGAADVISAYTTDETYALEEAGIPYTVLSPMMSGVDFYGDVLFTTADLIKRNPDLVKKFREASLKGWQYALENQKEIIELIFNKYTQRHSIRYLIHESEHMKSLIIHDVVNIGYSNPDRWQHILKTYQKINLIGNDATIDGLLFEDYFKPKPKIPWNIILPFLLIIFVISAVSYIFFDKSRKLHAEIQHRRKIQQDLMESEELYRTLLSTSPDTIIITNLDGTIRFVSPMITRMFGYKEDEVLHKNLLYFIVEEERSRVQKDIANMLNGNFSGAKLFNGRRADNRTIPIECKGEFFRNSKGEPTGIVYYIRDITQQKKSEAKILKANRIYEFISQINQSIVLIRERDTLLQELCRIAIETGKFQMAWIGFIDEDTKLVQPYVFDGYENGYLSVMKKISVSDSPEGQGPTGNAIREGRHYFCNDIENDPHMVPWKEEALSRGYRSSIAIPLHQVGKIAGAITLYSPLTHFFDEEEIGLLDEVANNISYALDAMEKDKEIKELNTNLELKIADRTAQLAESNKNLHKEIEERIRIEIALKESEQNYRTVIENIKEVIFYTDAQGNWLFLNRSWTEITGFSLEESLGTLFLNYVHPDDRERNMEFFMPLMRREKEYCRHEIRYLTRDGGFRWIEVYARLKLDESGEAVGTYGTLRDITDRKLAQDFENELLQLSPKLTGIPLVEIPKALNLAMERIGQFLSADRAYIFEFDNMNDTMSNTYEWCNSGINPEIQNLQNLSNSSYPMLMANLRRLEDVVIPSVEEIADSWPIEGEAFQSQGIQSLVVLPMLTENKLIGFVGLDSVRQKKEYSQAELNILRVWGSMLASLINNQRTEYLLEQTRQNYETFFNTIDDFLWVLDEMGNIIHVNTTVKSRLGYADEELKNQSVLMVHPASRREEAEKIVKEMLQGKADFCPVPIVTKSGNFISVETRVKSGFWNNRPVIFGVSKDISKIELSEQKFSSAFQANAAMMSISRFKDGKFLDVNNAFVEITGYTREEVIGKSSLELGLFVEQEVRNEIKQQLDNNIPVVKKEVKTRTKDGTIRIGLLSADAINIGDQRCMLVVNLDITERIMAEEEVKKARLEAEEANSAKSEFLSRMSHELRTPMNSILGFAQLLDMGELLPGQRKGVGHIIKSGKHLLDLINEVLDISRIESGHISLLNESIQLSGVIHEMMDVVRHHAKERQISLKVIEPNDQDILVKTDKQRLKQILLNLLNNAIKYNKPGGKVVLETVIMPQVTGGDKTVRISVKDTGIGIAQKDISKLFNPFERIGAEKTATEGTGLGLSVVKRLVDAMGGHIGVYSVEQEGSEFWIEFPVTEEVISKKEMKGQLEEPGYQLKEKSGLLVYIEDNPSNLELVQEILMSQRENIRLLTDTKGSNAVHLAEEYRPGLILLDLNLPDIHGSEILKQLQANENTNEIPVVVISADAMPGQIEELIRAGAKKYITKPLDLNVLLNIIDEYFF